MTKKSKLVFFFYRFFLPGVTMFLFFFCASFNNREILFYSNSVDFFIRFMLCIWFCFLYVRLSTISSYAHYPKILWTKSDVGEKEKYIYIVASCFLGFGCGIITMWIIPFFFPDYTNLRLFIAIINGLLVFVPTVSHYWVLKV